VYGEELRSVIVAKICPEVFPSEDLDRSGHMVELALKGYPKLAADTILNKEVARELQTVVGNAIRRLNSEFITDAATREKAYEVLIEIAFNLFGAESILAGFSNRSKEGTVKNVLQTLKTWEMLEREQNGTATAARAVIEKILQEMRQVFMGRGMLAGMAGEIEKELRQDSLMESFVPAIKKAIHDNVYYQISTRRLSKLGNDSATGLRRLRHLGAVQVSSNPVIAARAYDEFPNLWQEFREVAKAHPEWLSNPDSHADEIALYGTITSLLPNLLVFRPLALLSDFQDGFVSYQLNPRVATDSKRTIADAMKIYTEIEEILWRYDAHLMWKTDLEGRGRPNLVFKVAACASAAIETTVQLNNIGIGTNNTVTYTVSQETTLILAAMKGLSGALKMGIPITQIYETNMIGRLEDHLRETEAERLAREALEELGDRDRSLEDLAQRLQAFEDVKHVPSFDGRIALICSKKYIKSLTDARFVQFLEEAHGKSQAMEDKLSQLEKDIEHAGILVTRRVYEIFFSPKNRSKWIEYIQKEFGVDRNNAGEVLDRIDLLPASKRRAADTYLVLGRPGLGNLTNTEFPDQQLQVWLASKQKGFRLSKFEESIMTAPDKRMLQRLLRIEDFRKAYELSPEIAQKLARAGIRGQLGLSGLRPEDWPQFGAVKKTMNEFEAAYLNFRQRTVDFVRKVAQETGQT
jgi:transaldolase